MRPVRRGNTRERPGPILITDLADWSLRLGRGRSGKGGLHEIRSSKIGKALFQRARSRSRIIHARCKSLAQSRFRFEANVDLRGVFAIRSPCLQTRRYADGTVDQYNRIGKRIGREVPIAFGRLLAAELTRWLTRSLARANAAPPEPCDFGFLKN